MNYYAVSGLLTSISAIVSGLLVFLHNPRINKNITFSLFCLTLGIYTLFYALWQMADNAQSALLYIRLSIISVAFSAPSNYHAILALSEDHKPARRKFLYGLYAMAFTMAAFGFSKYFIPNVEPKLNFPFWPNPGIFIHILFLTLPIPIIALLILINEMKNKATALVRNQLKWMSLGIAVGYGCGITNCPLWYNIPIKPFLMIFTVFLAPIQAIIYFKLGLLDFRFFFQKLLTNTVASLSIGILFFLGTFFFIRDVRILIPLLLLAFTFPFLYPTLQKKIKVWFGKISQKEIGQSIEKIKETTYTYDDLAKNIVASLLNTFPIEMAAVYFYDLSRKELHLRAQRGMRSPLVTNLRYNRTALAIPLLDPLVQFLSGKNIASLDGLRMESDQNTTLKPIMESMNRIEAEVCAPFVFAGQLRGILVLSRKKDNSLFNEEDMEAIYAFTRMGEEIMRYIMGMETELRNTSLYSHDMAHDARSIIQTLEFVSSPMAEKQPREKINRLVDQAKTVANRLYDIFQMNRDRSNLILKSVRGEYEKVSVDIVKAVRLATEKYALIAEKQNIHLTTDIQAKPATVLGNELDLIRIMDNLLSNGLRYVSPEGHISVKAQAEGNEFQIEIKDDGAGIDPKNLDKIWEMGWQADDNKKGSAGLGLSIVKQIVDLHQGTIAAFSEGSGKGTTFTIKLPISAAPTK